MDHRNESGSSGGEEDAERRGPFEAEAGEDGALKGVKDGEPRLFESLLSVNKTLSTLSSLVWTTVIGVTLHL